MLVSSADVGHIRVRVRGCLGRGATVPIVIGTLGNDGFSLGFTNVISSFRRPQAANFSRVRALPTIERVAGLPSETKNSAIVPDESMHPAYALGSPEVRMTFLFHRYLTGLG